MEGIITPKFVIISYGDYYEQRAVKAGIIGPAQPLSNAYLKEMAERFIKYSDKPTIEGVPFPNILYLTANYSDIKVVWWTPASKRPLFSTHKYVQAGMQDTASLLFEYTKGDLKVWAINDKKQICHSPYGNCYQHGGVCMKVEKTRNLQTIRELEDRFWTTEFTHNNEQNCKDWMMKRKLNPIKNHEYASLIP